MKCEEILRKSYLITYWCKLRRITTGSRIQVENNFSENKCIVIFLTYLLILEQLLIEKSPLEHYKLEGKWTISSADCVLFTVTHTVTLEEAYWRFKSSIYLYEIRYNIK